MRIYRRMAMALAGLMLVTSASFSLDMHFCQGNIKSISLVGKAKACYDQEVCHRQDSSKDLITKKPCCADQTATIQNLDFDSSSQKGKTKHENAKTPFVARSLQVLTYEWLTNHRPDHVHYKPPLPDREVLILFQRFLI